MNPTAFTTDLNTTLWVMDDRVAIFNIDHAYIVFSHCPPNLQVWGIKGTVANLLGSYDQAIEFFGEEK